MKLLVTGANGFLGRYVVAEALRRGHAVRAMVRAEKDAARHGWLGAPGIEIAVADLRRRRGLTEVLTGVDAVLHLAAAKDGDMYAQFSGNVVATENLLSAMSEAGVRRIVQISSFAVYDYLRIRTLSVVDESSPLVADHSDRDEYAHTKLAQEKLVRTYCASHGMDFAVLRPGVIFGPDNLWTARLGVKGKKRWIRIGAWARLPLTYVENAAEAIVLAAERAEAKGQILNVVDDEMPTQRSYMSMLRTRTNPRPRVVPVAWTVMRTLAASASLFNRLFLQGRAKVPGFLVPSRLHARCKPLRYSNSRIKQVLGWKPRYPIGEALDRSDSLVTGGPADSAGSISVQQRLPAQMTDLISIGGR